MQFKVGDIVTLSQFKRDGTILEVLPNGSYKVTLGNLVLTVQAEHIVATDKKPSKKRETATKEFSIQHATPGTSEKEELDLHGVTVMDALNKVEHKLNRAVLSNLHRVKIIHGIGSGALRDAIHEYLAGCSIVASFKLDDFNPGTTWVYL